MLGVVVRVVCALWVSHLLLRVKENALVLDVFILNLFVVLITLIIRYTNIATPNIVNPFLNHFGKENLFCSQHELLIQILIPQKYF